MGPGGGTARTVQHKCLQVSEWLNWSGAAQRYICL